MKKDLHRQGKPLIFADHLTVAIQRPGHLFYPVQNVSFSINSGRTLALVGESGSGKTMTALSLLGLLPPAAQQIGGLFWFNGQVVGGRGENSREKLRGKEIAIIFQDPFSALNPVFRIGTQFKDVVKTHFQVSSPHAKRRIYTFLEKVGFGNPERIYKAFPHQLSGGMAQRAMIALAVACEPKFIIADEPTTALDVITQQRILELITFLQRRFGFAMLFITHDIHLAVRISDDLGVMSNGHLAEIGKTSEVVKNPAHPETKALLNSTFRLEHNMNQKKKLNLEESLKPVG